MNTILVVIALALPARAQVKGLIVPEGVTVPVAPRTPGYEPTMPPTSLGPILLGLPKPFVTAAPNPSSQLRMNSVAGGVIRAFGTGSSESDVAGAVPSKEAPIAHPEASLEAPSVVDKKGNEHPLSYVPGTAQESLGSILVRNLRDLPEKIRRIRRFAQRVDDLTEAVTDEELSWSFNRLEALVNQEGILRSDNTALLNKWTDRDQLKRVSHRDFADSSLEPVSVMKMFKATMDMEQPTLQYQYAFAQSLHNSMPRMSHFLGTTFQERLLQVALKGKPGQMAIWSNEEVRHGPILEAAFNAAEFPGFNKLEMQGAAPRLPREGGDYVARSGMSNRSLAELGASGAYLTLKANSTAGSPTDKVMEGVYRDEVYHHAIMSAVNRFVLGHESRLKRLYLILRHDLDFRPNGPNDRVRHYRRPFSPLMVLEYAYAMNKVDKRVNRFLDKLDPIEARRIIGPYYKNDAEIDAAVARGEHSRTNLFPMEVNPALTKADIETLIRRQPKNFSMARRAVKASDLQAVLDNYRKTSLKNPQYWLRKKGYDELGSDLLLKSVRGGSIALSFGERVGPNIAVMGEGGEVLWSERLDTMSFPQIGAIMDAEGVEVAAKLRSTQGDLSYAELLKRLSNSPAYQKDPIVLVDDGPKKKL